MLKSYEAIYENGQVKWLEEQPLKSARVIVIFLEENASAVKRRTPPASIAGKGKTRGDIISPVVSEAEWECLK